MPPTATLGIARQRHCAQHHRHHYRLCVERGGEGEGALWFPVLWVILPHPAPVVPCLVVPCVGQGARPSLGGQLRG